MKAVIHHRYGTPEQALRIDEIEKPEARDDEVLIRVRAASMHPDIWHVVAGIPYTLRLMGNGLFAPKKKTPGSDLAGVVESTGRNVTRFKAGDAVFGESVDFGWRNGGAYAEYASVAENLLAHKPENVTFEQAAAVPTAGYIALGNIQSALPLENKSVLINGAGGCMGTLAIQIIKAEGAQVTAVDRTEKLALMQSLGADKVIDYTAVNILEQGERFDFILDVASTLWFDVCKPILNPNGIYLPIGHADFGRARGRMGGNIVGAMPVFIGLLIRTLMSSQKRKRFRIIPKQEAMEQLRKLLESGQLTPVVGKTISLEEVADGMQDMIEGKTVGRIIITP